MTKYLLLKHYRGDHDLAAHDLAPMDQWTADEIDAHIAFMGGSCVSTWGRPPGRPSRPTTRSCC